MLLWLQASGRRRPRLTPPSAARTPLHTLRTNRLLFTPRQALTSGGCKYAEEKETGGVVPQSLFDLSANDLDSGSPVSFADYKGCVCLVVNVASK